MRLFKIPTRKAEFYDSRDAAALRQRVIELESVVEKYRSKRVGPYKMTLEISAPEWPGIVGVLRWYLESAEKHGPDGLAMMGADSGGYNYSCIIESNMVGGPGEPDEADEHA